MEDRWMTGQRPDAELVEAARQGSEEAFGELLARYRDAVFGVAFHRLGDFEEARDVVQEVFVKAYLGLGALRDPSAFARWLYRIADGTATDAARRPRHEQPLTGAEIVPDRTQEAELAREVRELIARLSEPTRLAVVLHYVNGYTHAEVAHFLGTTPEAVKMRLSRARSTLREELTEMVGERIKRGARPAPHSTRIHSRDRQPLPRAPAHQTPAACECESLHACADIPAAAVESNAATTPALQAHRA
jgi:RNA polymerase sigma-70 factor (ECF subfamily)